MIKSVFVQEHQKGKPSVESSAAIRYFEEREIPVSTFSLKHMSRGRLPITNETMVVGDMDAMMLAFRKLHVEGPFLDSYPAGTQAFLHRRVWQSSIARVLESSTPVFVKPAHKCKRFTGFVFEPGADMFGFSGASRHTSVLCSEPVQFSAEYRAYVCRRQIVGIAQYSGLPTAMPSHADIQPIVQAMVEAGSIVSGLSIDVGYLADGRFALVECNDGFALGLYEGMDPLLYTELLVARWSELARADCSTGC